MLTADSVKTEAQAWRWLAAHIEEYVADQEYDRLPDNADGLCWLVGWGRRLDRLPKPGLWDAMGRRLDAIINLARPEIQAAGVWDGYLFRMYEASPRIILCYFLALEAEQEAEEGRSDG